MQVNLIHGTFNLSALYTICIGGVSHESCYCLKKMRYLSSVRKVRKVCCYDFTEQGSVKHGWF